MENKLSIIPQKLKEVKYKRKVKIADIKQYLVDEYNLTKELDKENRNLKSQIEELEISKQKYELTLVTLDEYKKRIERKNEDIKELENQKKELKNKNRLLTNEKNDIKIQLKAFEKDMSKIEKKISKEIISQLVSKIQKAKGTLSKQKAIEIIKGEKDER